MILPENILLCAQLFIDPVEIHLRIREFQENAFLLIFFLFYIFLFFISLFLKSQVHLKFTFSLSYMPYHPNTEEIFLLVSFIFVCACAREAYIIYIIIR